MIPEAIAIGPTRSGGMDLWLRQFESGIRSAPVPVLVYCISGARGRAIAERSGKTRNESRLLQIPRILERAANRYGRSNGARRIISSVKLVADRAFSGNSTFQIHVRISASINPQANRDRVRLRLMWSGAEIPARLSHFRPSSERSSEAKLGSSLRSTPQNHNRSSFICRKRKLSSSF